MARVKKLEDTITLQMALVGYQIEKQKIDAKIKEIEARLRGTRPVAQGTTEKRGAAPKRVLSAAARRRIAAAQRKRWAEHRKRIAAAKKGE